MYTKISPKPLSMALLEKIKILGGEKGIKNDLGSLHRDLKKLPNDTRYTPGVETKK
jgi:hypothetical protein